MQLRRFRYLNNMIEQDHRFIKQLVKPGLNFKSFRTAYQILLDYEMMSMVRGGQIVGVEKPDILKRIQFIANLFMVTA